MASFRSAFFGPRHAPRLAGLVLAAVGGLGLVGCGPTTNSVCQTNADCGGSSSGLYCRKLSADLSAHGVCTRTDQIPPTDAASVDAGRDAAASDATTTSDVGPESDAGVESDAGESDASVEPDAFVSPDAFVAPDAFVSPDAFVEPDAFVSPDAFVAPDAFVSPDAFVEPDAFVDADAGDGAVALLASTSFEIG